jgi:hypothetical protein
MMQWSSDREIVARLNLRSNASEFAAYNAEGRLLRLALRRPHIPALPQEFWNLSDLQDLTLQLFKKLRSPASPSSPEIGLSSDIGWLSCLQRLDLSHSQLAALPMELGQLSQLRILNVSNNQFTTVPPAVLHLTNLQVLLLHANRLSVVPPEIGQLSQLRVLSLSGDFTALPAEIWQLPDLQELRLWGTGLTTLPQKLHSFPTCSACRATTLRQCPQRLGS